MVLKSPPSPRIVMRLLRPLDRSNGSFVSLCAVESTQGLRFTRSSTFKVDSQLTDDSGARRLVPDPVGLTMRLPTSRLMDASRFVAGDDDDSSIRGSRSTFLFYFCEGSKT